MNISVFGLGKVGSVIACLMASKGHKVYGFDSNSKVIENFENYCATVVEDGLAELYVLGKPNLELISDPNKAVANSDISVIIVPTPSLPNGAFSNLFVQEAIEVISKAAAKKGRPHEISLKSTVMPGSCTVLAERARELSNGLARLIYNPEFIAQGTILKNMLQPDVVLVGTDRDEPSLTEELSSANLGKIFKMSFESAEVSKLAINSYVTLKIVFANYLDELAEKLDGASASEIASAVGADSRIGSSYLKPGLGFGGPCFPRDNIAMATFATEIGASPDLPLIAHNSNTKRAASIASRIVKLLRPQQTVGVFGLSYKEGTNLTVESSSIAVCQELQKKGIRVIGYDINVRETDAPEWLTMVNSLEELVLSSDLVFLGHPKTADLVRKIDDEKKLYNPWV